MWPAQVLISPDADQSWELLPTRVEEDPLPEPPLNERLYGGGWSGGSFATGVNIYRNDDGGDNWTLAHQFFIPIGEESSPIPHAITGNGTGLVGWVGALLTHRRRPCAPPKDWR